jgi:hypothetical protein
LVKCQIQGSSIPHSLNRVYQLAASRLIERARLQIFCGVARSAALTFGNWYDVFFLVQMGICELHFFFSTPQTKHAAGAHSLSKIASIVPQNAAA